MTPQTKVLANGVLTVQAYTAYTLRDPQDRAQVPAQISFQAGTGTVVIEGREDPSHDWVLLSSQTADFVGLITKTKQMRVNVTAATGLTARVSVDAWLKAHA